MRTQTAILNVSRVYAFIERDMSLMILIRYIYAIVSDNSLTTYNPSTCLLEI